MNDILKVVLGFSAGAAVGAVVAWKLLEKKYEIMSHEEIEEIREFYSTRAVEKEFEDAVDEEAAESLKEYSSITNMYKKDAEKKEAKKGGVEDMYDTEKPYVIPPEEFGEYGDDYETETFTYFADGVVTDDQDNIVEDVDGLIGEESLEHFGEYEDDSVYVRNDELKCDYEILLDVRNYSDVYGEH